MGVDAFTSGLDTGNGSYEIMPEVWEEIGMETAAAVKDIPSAFVGVLPNIADSRASFTAKSWGFWFMYIAPIILRGRFLCNKYYTHACQLADLMKLSIKLQLTHEELEGLRIGFIDWVDKYENMGTLDIFLERYSRRSDELFQQEKEFPDYPNQVLRAPCKLQYRPDQDLRCRISIYFQQVLGGRCTEFAAQLPEVMPLWGKLEFVAGMQYVLHLHFNGYSKSPGTTRSCDMKLPIMGKTNETCQSMPSVISV
ncbi:hypothetical protein BU15DRAFT_68994 [Melanogaster broomeanus]|nr:hypothetical protein BU15DRAFT_68994 [Melanogaster broomeanus]